MKNVVIHLIGYAGTGKQTIGKALCPALDAVLIDSHLINNPVFKAIRVDGKSKLPPKVWDLTRAIRKAVLEAIETCAPQGTSYVFTNALFNEVPRDRELLDNILLPALARAGKTYIPVRLACSADELEKRRTSPERASHHKDTSARNLHEELQQKTIINTGHPNEITLDITTLTAAESAAAILSTIQEKMARTS